MLIDIAARLLRKQTASRICGGFLLMNPALVICSICEGQLWISTYAKSMIIWKNEDELISKLERRIQATIKRPN